MSRTFLLLALCSVAQAITFNEQSDFQTYLDSIGPNLHISGPGAEFAKVIAAGPAPQRLPVTGFGCTVPHFMVDCCTACNLALIVPSELQIPPPQPSGPGLSFSNPPPPLGTDTDPAAQTCGLSPPFCTKSRYRSIDGSCNNLARPSWGTPQTPYGRLVAYNYADGISAWPRATSGAPLPNARLISNLLFPDINLVSPLWNLNAQQWGQIVTHDMSLTAGVAQTPDDSKKETDQDKDQLTCCDDNGQLAPDSATNPTCAPILIPPNDPVHASQGTQCMNFVRTGSTLTRGCTGPNAPAEPLTTVTSYMDLSLVYGSSAGQANPIRAFRGGRLLTVLRGGQEWPPQDPNITQTCESAQSVNEPCYLTGDIRTNQNPQLAILQIILLREHNRIADSLAKLNPHWSDDILFQEARRINIAIFQHINYYEYLPILLGTDNMVNNKLIYPGAQGYVNDYNQNVDPTVLDEHATAAFRHFHTMIRGYLKLFSDARSVVGTIRLSDWFNRPIIVEQRGSFAGLARGLASEETSASDQFWTSEITQFLFKRNNTFGGDLRATDIQRGRDHGLGSYIATRAACGLPVPKYFDDLLDFISADNVKVLKTLYESIYDLDLVAVGSLEKNVPGAQAGPTFLCILTEQFYRTRVGDRYFYENGADPDTAFTPSQLEAIRRGSSMARLFCDNSDDIRLMQPKAFQQVGKGNRLVPCRKLPYVDLRLWQDARGQYKK